MKKDDNSEKGNITYIYDAAGNKLEKRVSENNVVKTTTYISGFVYEDNKLQFLGHEEGRIRYTPAEGTTAARFDYDYFIKDHLGNVRMVLTDEVQTIYYPAATLEGNYNDPNANSMVNHEKKYYNIDNNYITATTSIPSWGDAANTGYKNNNGNPPVNSNYPSGTAPSQTDNNERLYRLNGATNKTGLQFVVKVMSGDRVDIFGKSYYHSNQTFNNSNSTLLDIGTIMAGVLLPPGSVAGSKGMTSGNLTSLNDLLLPGSFIRGNNGENVQIPKAYINYILLDEQFRYVSGSASRVGSSDEVKSHWQSDPALRDIEVGKNGYLYVYVSNESNVDVFFDNLQIVHRPGPLVEETHYYPFGLTMAGISSKAQKSKYNENKHKFNGIEQNTDFDLNMYDAFYRNLDPQIGRWWQIDPKCEVAINPDAIEEDEAKVEALESLTPYNSMGNNPVKHSDPKGDLFGIDNLIGGVVSGLVELGSQVVSNAISGKKLSDISWKQVGVAAGEGFLTSGASTVTKLVVKGVAAVASSAVDYVESGNKINSFKDVGNIAKNAAIGVVADKATGAVAKIAKGVGSKTLQNVSNNIIGSKNQIVKNIVANNAISTKSATAIAKTVQSAQKDIAKTVREAPVKAAETITKGAANPVVTTVKDKTNL